MSKNGVRVVVRTRPTAAFAQDRIFINSISVNQSDPDVKKDAVNNKKDFQTFQFHQMLHNATQDTVYDSIGAKIVSTVMEGYNGTIMAYGQTGAGKTFTMVGRPGDYKQRGVIPRAVAQIFQEVEARSDMEFNIQVSYLEIYNERIFDLLTDNANPDADYQIYEEKGAHGMDIFIRGLTKIQVNSEEEALDEMFKGESRRTTAEHMLNKNSSRSHCIFTLYVEQQSRLGDASKILSSKLHLVDLAGSERLKKTLDQETTKHITVEDITKKESIYINRSLSYLEQCVIALTQPERGHIPYRQSKLTNILKDSLGGNCRTVLIANIWGEARHIEETISTLRFASRMMRVKSTASTNIFSDPVQLLKKYENQIKELKAELMLVAAFNGKSGEIYSDLTDSQRTELAKKVKQFIDAPENEEDGILEFTSLKQVKEIFQQFKRVSKEMAHEVEEKLKADFELTEKQQQQQPSVDVNAPPGANGANGASVDTPQGPGVGELVSGGFALGVAAPGSRPKAIDRRSPGTSRSRSRSITASPGIKNMPSVSSYMESPLNNNANSMNNNNNGGLNTTSLIPGMDKKAAFEQCEGRQFNRSLLAEKEHYKNTVEEIKDLTAQINNTKKRIDELKAQSEQKRKMGDEVVIDGEKVIDEEEYRILRDLSEAKKQYRSLSDTYQSKKEELHSCDESVNQERKLLLEKFEKYYAGEPLDDYNPYDSKEDGDDLDYGEQFSKMEIENVMSKDPKSLAFFNISFFLLAQKHVAKSPMKSPMRTRNIRK